MKNANVSAELICGQEYEVRLRVTTERGSISVVAESFPFGHHAAAVEAFKRASYVLGSEAND